MSLCVHVHNGPYTYFHTFQYFPYFRSFPLKERTIETVMESGESRKTAKWRLFIRNGNYKFSHKHTIPKSETRFVH